MTDNFNCLVNFVIYCNSVIFDAMACDITLLKCTEPLNKTELSLISSSQPTLQNIYIHPVGFLKYCVAIFRPNTLDYAEVKLLSLFTASKGQDRLAQGEAASLKAFSI